ncbi:MAG TPA: putative ABC exporter domain-containing protein [Thermoanaerobaculia bacterium]|nr:putative ABC exporter domain-containing protein [Thermoanaerobaculia bacterium]
MNGALLEILWLSFRGGLVRRLRRLRQPRYLFAMLASLAYVAFWLGPSFVSTWSRPGRARGAASWLQASSPLLLAIALGGAGTLTLIWLFASSKPGLWLNEADLHLLLPAPLPRRKLLEYSLWKQQLGLFFGALVVSLLRGYGSAAARLLRFFLVWGLLALMTMHGQGVSLWKARLRELPAAAARLRRGLAVALLASYWTAVAFALYRALAPLLERLRSGAYGAAAGAGEMRGVAAELAALLSGARAAPLLALLAPFRWLAGAFLGGGGLRGALLLAVLLVVHYEWVVRSRGRFEDATLEKARRAVERRVRRPAAAAASARARLLEPFALPSRGTPEIAIWWKNLLLSERAPLARNGWLIAALFAALCAAGIALRSPQAYNATVTGLATMVLVLLPPLAGIFFRNDLRADLLQLEILRSWPIAGWRLVAAELLAPATAALRLMLAAYAAILGVALAASVSGAEPGQMIPPGLRGTDHPFAFLACAYAGILAAGVPLALLSIGIQNLAALMLPGWVNLGLERRRGAAFTGPRILIFLGHLIALAVALLPVLLLEGAVVLGQRLLGAPFSPWEIPLLALLAAPPLLAETWLLVRVGGAYWDRLDPSQEMLSLEE